MILTVPIETLFTVRTMKPHIRWGLGHFWRSTWAVDVFSVIHNGTTAMRPLTTINIANWLAGVA